MARWAAHRPARLFATPAAPGQADRAPRARRRRLDEYSARAYKWARSAWEAWGEHRDQARAWVEEVLAEERRAG
ncbi:MAG: hypothetical protein AVDCRST_MAG12-119 [uncultured Rubrobacteraceae bacterium]|uniref:Uncharacterized protein n=1 Tax=uncultured Rubrobacteraceae bacterium TaxID=349277 RepID=A0A6J4R889_9ACTN|nr:MAG: hypothetical protein AVDCRST_MAG12-119 [uncultured Rubrobacteraceae bacterium]